MSSPERPAGAASPEAHIEEGIAVVLGLEDLRGPAATPVSLHAVNFHNLGPSRRARHERVLSAVAAGYAATGAAGLEAVLAGHPAPGGRPPLLVVFYEGFRTQYDVALPLLERLGLVGWFVVPTAFVDAPAQEQRAAAEGPLELELGAEHPYGDPRWAMSWDELREVAARGHVVACHTATHRAASDLRGAEDFERELVAPRARLEAELGVTVDALAFQWGAPFGQDARLDAAILDAGYRWVLSNHRVQRLPAP